MKNPVVRAIVGGLLLAACQQGLAATATVTATQISLEKTSDLVVTNPAQLITLPSTTVTLNPNVIYNDGDTVTIAITGATMRSGSFGTVGTEYLSCYDAGGTAAANLYMKLTPTSVSSSGATYTVTRGASSAAATCIFTGLQAVASSLTRAGTIVKLNYTAASSGVTSDGLRYSTSESNPLAPVTVLYVDSQFSAEGNSTNTEYIRALGSSTSYGAQQRFVNAGYNGSTFAAGVFTATPTTANSTTQALNNTLDNTAKTTAVIVINAASDGTGNFSAAPASLLATAGSTVRINYTGDFSFLDNNGDGCTTADLSSGWARVAAARLDGGAAVTTAINRACTVITTTGVGDRAESLTFTVGAVSGSATTTNQNFYTTSSSSTVGAKTIPAQNIAVTATWTDGTGTVLGSASPLYYPPVWALNAWSNDIPYMPYGAGISRILYITNRSSTAPVSISAVNEAGVSCASTNFPSVSARGSSTTSISAAADAGVAACYGADYTGKVRFTVTVGVSPQTRDTLRINGSYPGDNTSATGAAGVPFVYCEPGSTNASACTARANATGASGILAPAQAGTVQRARSDIDIYSAYNVNGNRVTVINPSNGR